MTTGAIATIGVSIAVAAIGSVTASVRLTEGKIDIINENTSSYLQRLTKVETESTQYRQDITGINSKLDEVLKAIK